MDLSDHILLPFDDEFLHWGRLMEFIQTLYPISLFDLSLEFFPKCYWKEIIGRVLTIYVNCISRENVNFLVFSHV